MPSSRANRYGSLAERKVAERYRLVRDGVHTSWCDAVDSDGTPVEIKSCDAGRDAPRFRIFEKYHDRLQSEGGHYVFVLYKKRGRGITVLRMTRMHASRLPAETCYGAGGHRESRQTKLRPKTVF